jgi:stage V sporulation protein R
VAGEKVTDEKDLKEHIQEDLLFFIIRHGRLEEWERNIIEAVRNESLYFIPQIETKIMNEGWASYWHYTILKELDLPQGLHIEFIKRHNDVVRPHLGRINPYYLGFLMFNDIEARYGKEKIFEVRELERDASFLRRYLTHDMCLEANLFQYAQKNTDYVIEEISDEDGWKDIRNTLSSTCGTGGIPVIKALEVNPKDKKLTLQHVYDGRELLINYAQSTLKYVQELWGYQVELKTIISNQETTLKVQ